MNENILDYINGLSYEDVRRIYEGFARDARPQAKAYWGRLMSAKRYGWNDSLAQSFTQDIEALGADNILGVLPTQTYNRLILQTQPTKTNPNLPYSPSSRDFTNYGGVGKYTKGPALTPDSFTPGSGSIPDPEDFELQDVVTPSRAALIPKGVNTQVTGDRGSTGPKNPRQRPPLDRSSTRASVDVPERDNPFANDPDIKESLSRLKNSSIESIRNQVTQMEQRIAGTPSTDLARRESLNYFLQDAKSALGPLADVLNFIEQRREEKTARGVADRSMLNAPTPPSVRGENRMLSNLIMNSQVAYSNPAQMIQPYMDQVNLGYQQDLAQAQELSGGQAGTAMGLGQAASIRRNQANLATAPMLSDIYRQGIETTGALVGQQMQDDTWRDQQTIDLYRIANQNNQDLQQQAGMGLAASRMRSIQARNNMLDSLLNSPVFDVNTYMTQTRQNLVNPPTI